MYKIRIAPLYIVCASHTAENALHSALHVVMPIVSCYESHPALVVAKSKSDGLIDSIDCRLKNEDHKLSAVGLILHAAPQAVIAHG